jgi:molecular chaperone DnaK (HSP70)
VGRAAEAFQHSDPQHFIYNAKRFIGRNMSDPAVMEQGPRHPFMLGKEGLNDEAPFMNFRRRSPDISR